MPRSDQENELTNLSLTANHLEEAKNDGESDDSDDERFSVQLTPNPEEDHAEQNAQYNRIYQAALALNEAELKAIQAEGVHLEKTRFVESRYEKYSASEKLAREGHLQSVLLLLQLDANSEEFEAIDNVIRGALQGKQLTVCWHIIKLILLANLPESLANEMIDSVIVIGQLSTKESAEKTLASCFDEFYPKFLARISYYQANPNLMDDFVQLDRGEEKKTDDNLLKKYFCPEIHALILAENIIRQEIKKYPMTRDEFVAWKNMQTASKVNEALNMQVLALQAGNLPIREVLPLIDSFAFPFSDEKSHFLNKRTSLVHDLAVFQTSTASFFASKKAANLKDRCVKAQSFAELKTMLFKSAVDDTFNGKAEESNESGLTELVNQHLPNLR